MLLQSLEYTADFASEFFTKKKKKRETGGKKWKKIKLGMNVDISNRE